MGRRVRGQDTERGANIVEYTALIAIVGAVAAIIAASDIGATITTGIQRAVCSAFGGDCEVDETTTDESPDTHDPDRDYAEDMDESLGEGSPAPPETPAEHTTEPGEPPQSDPPPPVDEDTVEETLDLIEEWRNDRSFVDTIWPWTGTPSRTDIEQQLHDLNRGELDDVISELSDEEIRELLGPPSEVDLLQDIVFDNASIETIRRIREVDPDYFIKHEPSYEGMEMETPALEDAEHGFPEDGSIWGEGEALDERISIDHIAQGQVADCYFLAEVGAIAQQNPEIIDDMITENADGTFTVEFADGSDYTVTPDVPLDEYGNPIFHGSRDNPVMWPALLEQAYAEHEGGHYEDIAQRQGRDPTGEVLTGTETDFDTTDDLTPADLHETWAEDGSITLSSFQQDEAPDSDHYQYLEDDDNFPGDPIDPEDPDAGYTLYTNHVYVVTEVRDNGDVEVFNPHGAGEEQVIPFDELDESFSAVRTNDLD